MREIKFRAWDINNSCWVKNPTEQFFVNFYSNNGMPVFMFDSRGCEDLYSQGFRLQQFIGLKDKYGKEIYEGDIIRHKTYGYSVVKTGVVRWIDNETRFTFDVIGTNEKLLIDEHDEVIGNIYENPELLNKESK